MSTNSESLLPVSVRTSLVERAENGQLELPVLPDSVARVLTLSQSPDSDVYEIAGLIERDQSLAAHVLHLSNSAAFAPTQPIVSLQQAVARLGMSTLCEVTLAVVLKGSVFEVPGFERTLARLWRHSAAAGVFAKEIARTLRRNVEGAFLCGLLHDVGKPVTLSVLANICEEVHVELDTEIGEAAMDDYHSLMGAMLVRDWGLAPWVEAAAAHHHDYSEAQEHRTEAMVVCFADQLAHWAMGTNDVEEEDLFGLQVVTDLDLYQDDVRRLLAGRDAAIEIAEAFA